MSRMSTSQRIGVGASLLMMYIPVIVAVWFWFCDTEPPSRIEYQHDKFVSIAVDTREDAKRWEITTAFPGQVVFRYEEYCMESDAMGVVKKVWIDGIKYEVPEVRNLGQAGCFKRSFPEVIPSAILSPKTLTYSARIEYPDENLLRTQVLHIPEITIKVVP